MLDESGDICIVFEYKNCLAQTVFPRWCNRRYRKAWLGTIANSLSHMGKENANVV